MLKKPIYLDYAATTPLDPKVKKAMEPFLTLEYGNPSSLYKLGIDAKRAIDGSRKSIAQIINTRPQKIIFTAGGTESCNLAIFGITRAYEQKFKRKGHIITSAVEHHAVLEPIKALQKQGWSVTYLKVDDEGFVKTSDIKKAIKNNTVLVSVIMANNEVGTIEPIGEIGHIIKTENLKRKHKILFHTDACQATGFLKIDVQKLSVDLLSSNASKIYGPKQTGFLFVRQGINIAPLIYGGGQEKGLRSGTENVAGIVGLARALELVTMDREKENQRLVLLRDYFAKKVLDTIEGATLNGPWLWLDKKGRKQINRLPSNVSISFEGVEGEALMLYLDAHGIAVSTGSACSTGKPDPSHVIKAMGRNEKQAKSTIRFTLGKQTNKADLDFVLKTLPKLITQLRKVKSL